METLRFPAGQELAPLMIAIAATKLISEVEGAVQGCSAARRLFVRLIAHVEDPMLAQLSPSLAGLTSVADAGADA